MRIPHWRVSLRAHGVGAVACATAILAGHWYRNRQLDWSDMAYALLAVPVYLALASWLRRGEDARGEG